MDITPIHPPLATIGTSSLAFVRRSFILMSLALFITGCVAFLFYTTPALYNMLYEVDYKGSMHVTWVFYVALFSPLAIILLNQRFQARLTAESMLLLFGALAVFEGMSLSSIFLVYADASIFQTFFICSAMFLAMGIIGYTSKADLTSWGNIAIMGVIGLIIAGIVNFWLQSDTLQFIVSIIGVAAFSLLTAYDVQKIKNIAATAEESDSPTKLSVLCALTLYLDFVNLFLYLLRLFGNRKR